MENEIKLIISDIDGTLVFKDEKQASKTTIDTINNAIEKGKIFAVASGRSQNSIKRVIKPQKDLIVSACDGAIVKQNEKIIYQIPIESEDLKKIIPKMTGVSYAFYGENEAWVSDDEVIDKVFLTEGEENTRLISSFSFDKAVYKVAIFTPDMENCYAHRYITQNRVIRFCYKNNFCMEYVNNNADKGKTVLFLQKQNNIKYEETAIFGDNHNDIDMLKQGYYSYAVGNAKEEIKALARFKTPNAVAEINKFLK